MAAVNNSKDADIEKTDESEDDKPFRLMDLPVELVIRILMCAVVQSSKDCPIDLSYALKGNEPTSATAYRYFNTRQPIPLVEPPYRNAAASLLQPAITRTCRMLRTEGLDLFYGENYFHIQTLSSFDTSLSQWLACLHDTHRERLTLFLRRPRISNRLARSSFVHSLRMCVNFAEHSLSGTALGILSTGGKVLQEEVDGEWSYPLAFRGGKEKQLWQCEKMVDMINQGAAGAQIERILSYEPKDLERWEERQRQSERLRKEMLEGIFNPEGYPVGSRQSYIYRRWCERPSG